MPNMFGGDQDHPAYSGRRCRAYEALDGDILYTLHDNGTVSMDGVGGWIGTVRLAEDVLPKRVYRKLQKEADLVALEKKRKANVRALTKHPRSRRRR